MKKKVSVIIPAYNVSMYISECLYSVINQTYNNLEIIIVNDGSTDNTLNVCNSIYDERIKIINQENKGVSEARNVGMLQSIGDYVIFIDADDILEKNMIKTLADNMEKNNVEISICGYKRVFNDKSSINDKIEKKEKILKKNDAIELFFDGRYFGISLWDKLIKRELAEKISFEKNRKINEDKYYLFNAIINSNSIYLNNEGLYNYMQRENSVTKSRFDMKNLDILYFSNKIKKRIEDDYPEFKKMSLDNYIKDNIYVYRNIIREYSDNDNIYLYTKGIREELKKYKKNRSKKYSQIELILICNYIRLYKIFLKLFDMFIKKRRKK